MGTRASRKIQSTRSDKVLSRQQAPYRNANHRASVKIGHAGRGSAHGMVRVESTDNFSKALCKELATRISFGRLGAVVHNLQSALIDHRGVTSIPTVSTRTIHILASRSIPRGRHCADLAGTVMLVGVRDTLPAESISREKLVQFLKPFRPDTSLLQAHAGLRTTINLEIRQRVHPQ